MTRRKYPSVDEVMFDVAKSLSRQATCPRKSVGCVIVDEWGTIISGGYNSAPLGMPTCNEVGCLIEGGHCVRAVHAEMAAVASVALRGARLKGARAYCTLLPCIQCLQTLVMSGVTEIYYADEYDRGEKAELFKLVGQLNIKLVGRTVR